MALDEPDIPESFWQLIEMARNNPGDWRSHLQALEREELDQFYRCYEEAAIELQDDDFIDYFEDLSEDGLDDQSRYAVALGRDRYIQVQERPDSIPRVTGDEPEFQVLSEMIKVYYERFDEPPPLETE